jgi:gamma-glutamyltranspeptidase / glutathione hydrolase
LVNVLDFGMPIQQAVEAPRFALDAEPNFYKSGAEITFQYEGRFLQDTVAGLKAKGHKVAMRPSYSIGSNQGTLLNKETGTITAGADPRRTQYAIGW